MKEIIMKIMKFSKIIILKPNHFIKIFWKCNKSKLYRFFKNYIGLISNYILLIAYYDKLKTSHQTFFSMVRASHITISSF